VNVTAVTRYTTVDNRDKQGDSTVCTSAARSQYRTLVPGRYKCVFVAPPSKSTCVGCWRGMYTGLLDDRKTETAADSTLDSTAAAPPRPTD